MRLGSGISFKNLADLKNGSKVPTRFYRIETAAFDEVVDYVRTKKLELDKPSEVDDIHYRYGDESTPLNCFLSPFCQQYPDSEDCVFLSSISCMILKGWSNCAYIGDLSVVTFDGQTVFILPKIIHCNRHMGDTTWPSVLTYLLEASGFYERGTAGLLLESFLPNLTCLEVSMSHLKETLPGNEWENLGVVLMNCDPNMEGVTKGLDPMHSYAFWMTIESGEGSCIMLFEPSMRTRGRCVRGISYWSEEEISSLTKKVTLVVRKKDLLKEIETSHRVNACILAAGKTEVTGQTVMNTLERGEILILEGLKVARGSFWVSVSTGTPEEEFMKKKGFLEVRSEWARQMMVGNEVSSTHTYRTTTDMESLCQMSEDLLLPLHICPYGEEISCNRYGRPGMSGPGSSVSQVSVKTSMTFWTDEFKSESVFLRCKDCKNPITCTKQVYAEGNSIWAFGNFNLCSKCGKFLGFWDGQTTDFMFICVQLQGRNLLKSHAIRFLQRKRPKKPEPLTTRHVMKRSALLEKELNLFRIQKKYGSFGKGRENVVLPGIRPGC